MKKIMTIIVLSCVSFQVLASSRVASTFIDARQTRLDEINLLSIKINQAEVSLANFRLDLSRVEANHSKFDHDIFMRNTAGVVSAIGFVATLIYHEEYIPHHAYMLVGGYTISTISAIIMAIENKGVQLDKKEISDIKESIKKIENIIASEKRNLQKEIDVLAKER